MDFEPNKLYKQKTYLGNSFEWLSENETFKNTYF